MYDHDTSGKAYQEGMNQRDFCRQVVYLAIRKLKHCNDRQIAQQIGWAINRVTPRRGELVQAGKVMPDGKGPDPETGRTVNYWRPANRFEQLSLF